MNKPTTPRGLARDPRGVVYVEFLLAFTPLFVFFLGLVQVSLLAVGALVVRHAAARAARSAIVILEDDPARYGGAARRDLLAIGDTDVAWEERLADVLGSGSVPAAESAAGSRIGYGGARMAAIARAAHAPLAAITPEPGRILEWLGLEDPSVARAFGSSPLRRLIHGLRHHLPLTTAVTLPIAPGAAALHESVVPVGAPVTVRVTHLFDCAVPIGAALLCDPIEWRAGLERLGWAGGDSTDDAAFDELRRAPGARDHALLAKADARFAVLRSEATLPAQHAPYRYASERSSAP